MFPQNQIQQTAAEQATSGMYTPSISVLSEQGNIRSVCKTFIYEHKTLQVVSSMTVKYMTTKQMKLFFMCKDQPSA